MAAPFHERFGDSVVEDGSCARCAAATEPRALPQDLIIDRYTSCLLGLAIGDACGAPHEGAPVERARWRWIGRTPEGLPRWTDDVHVTIRNGAAHLPAARIEACSGIERGATRLHARVGSPHP